VRASSDDVCAPPAGEYEYILNANMEYKKEFGGAMTIFILLIPGAMTIGLILCGYSK
jgi:hypothetical protein